MDKEDQNTPIEGEIVNVALIDYSPPDSARSRTELARENGRKGGLAKAEKAAQRAREGIMQAVRRRLAAGLTLQDAESEMRRITPYTAWGTLTGCIADIAADPQEAAPSRVRAYEAVGKSAGFLQRADSQQATAPVTIGNISDAAAEAMARVYAEYRAIHDINPID